MDEPTEPENASYRFSWAVHGMTMLQAEELSSVISVDAFDPGWIRKDLGGPDVPGSPEEAAERLRKTLLLPWESTGHFIKDGEQIPSCGSCSFEPRSGSRLTVDIII